MKTYCFRKCISIMHSNDDSREHAHGHTVEVGIYVKFTGDRHDISRTRYIKSTIEEVIDNYNLCYLNDRSGFEQDTSIERLGEVLFYEMDDKMALENIPFEKLEIAETPLRTYIITKVV